ncbi:hypothetical protein BDK51DRAFT_50481 [Blyttiomyces helicus]|uniref:GOLD domain-containing protein n=1 Tax=Blyttiomyces helicus TaxID=388810 RepID=A0A4P9WLI0_9FUNG|nr:hypothetical protein BDK51DRAFT_50481 [Blyttiomyces helicus]|eukprot:RKO93734.1 hypothetical protein BDK51DRAFT_50481 [Blyttiomyces helicus]
MQKRSNFLRDSLISGDLAVISSSTPQYQGDGSLEVDGTLYTDILESSTLMGNVSVTSVLSFPSRSRPVAPTSGNTLVFADSELDSRMAMMNAAGTVINLNRLTTVGDLLTFDGVNDTTTRFPGGLADQLLTYGPRGNSATQLSWKSSALALNFVYSPSDLYIRYATLTHSQGFALMSTSTGIPFDKMLRDIMKFWCIVGFSSENDLSVGIDACVELSIETGSGGSYTYLSGMKTYCNFEATNSTTPFDTLTCRCIVNVPTRGTYLRVLVREFQTTTNALILIPEMITISAMLLIVESPSTDSSEYLSFQDVPTNTLIIQTNSNDFVSAMTVTLADAGLRYMFGKNTLTSTVNCEIEILGTSGWKSLTAGSVGNVVVGQNVYLPPGVTVMAEDLSINGGTMSITDCGLIIDKIEVTISSFTGVPDFGCYYQFVHDDEIVQTTSTLFSLRLAVSTGTLASGMYRAGLSFDWDMSNAGVKFENQLLLDGSTVIDQYSDLPVITGTYQKVNSFTVFELTEGKHTFSFHTLVENSSWALYPKNVRFELSRI